MKFFHNWRSQPQRQSSNWWLIYDQDLDQKKTFSRKMSFCFYCLSYVFILRLFTPKRSQRGGGGILDNVSHGVSPRGSKRHSFSYLFFSRKVTTLSIYWNSIYTPFLYLKDMQITIYYSTRNGYTVKCFLFCFVLLLFCFFFSDYRWTSAYFELIQI